MGPSPIFGEIIAGDRVRYQDTSYHGTSGAFAYYYILRRKRREGSAVDVLDFLAKSTRWLRKWIGDRP